MGVIILESVVHTPEVTAAAITGILTLAGVIISNVASNRKVEHKLETAQAVTDNKIENLTNEVRRHNSFAEKLPVIETRVDGLEGRINKLESR